MSKVLSLSKDDYPSLGALLTGQNVTLSVKGNVLNANDSTVTLNVSNISISNKSKLSTNEIVQQLAEIRNKMPAAETQP